MSNRANIAPNRANFKFSASERGALIREGEERGGGNSNYNGSGRIYHDIIDWAYIL